MDDEPAGTHLVLYDGICGLCNRAVQFVLPRDPRGVFQFAALQSPVGQRWLRRFRADPGSFHTFYVVTNHRSTAPELLSKADAALFVARRLTAPWRWLGALGVIPAGPLDRIYDQVARHRYQVFGRHESCPMPAEEYRGRFLENVERRT